jgi:hypothetical protein
MEQSPPSEAGGLSTSHEIPHVLWNPKIHCCAQNSPPHTEPDKFNIRDPSIFLSIIPMQCKLPTST